MQLLFTHRAQLEEAIREARAYGWSEPQIKTACSMDFAGKDEGSDCDEGDENFAINSVHYAWRGLHEAEKAALAQAKNQP